MARSWHDEYMDGREGRPGTSAAHATGVFDQKVEDARAAETKEVERRSAALINAALPWHMIGPKHVASLVVFGAALFAVAFALAAFHAASLATAGVYPVVAPLAAAGIALWWTHGGRAEPQDRIGKAVAALAAVLVVGVAGGGGLPVYDYGAIAVMPLFDMLVATGAVVASALALMGGRASAALRFGIAVPALLLSWYFGTELGLYTSGPEDVDALSTLIRNVSIVLVVFALVSQAGLAAGCYGVERSGGRTRLAVVRDVHTTWSGHLLHVATWAPLVVLALARMQDVFRLIYGD